MVKGRESQSEGEDLLTEENFCFGKKGRVNGL
jgi:hypothetical protein